MACIAPSTAAAPPMSDFITSMDLAGLSDSPPESKVIPFPASTSDLDAASGADSSRTSPRGCPHARPPRPGGAHRALAPAEDPAVAALGERLLVEHGDRQPIVRRDLLGAGRERGRY